MLAYFRNNYRAIAFDPLPVFYDMFVGMRNRIPAPVPLALCHGDFQPSNFLYAKGKVSGLIDWENAHVGDPREDLGWFYHLSVLNGVDIFGAVQADGGFLQHYTKCSGIPVTMDDIRFFQVFTSAALSAPILAAVKRRLDGATSEFLHVYLLQSMVASNPMYAAILGYPPAQGAA